MEKEGAEKAITESDNSVTSKEENSLVEKKDNNNALTADTVADSLTVEEPSLVTEVEAEDLPQKEEPAVETQESPEDSIVRKPKPAKDDNDNPEPAESVAEEKPAEPKDNVAEEETPVKDALPVVEDEAAPDKEDGEVEAKDNVAAEGTPIKDALPVVTDEAVPEKENAEVEAKDNVVVEETPLKEALPVVADQAAPDKDNAEVEAKDSSKERAKKSSKKESAKEGKVIEEHPVAEEHHGADEHHEEYQNADFATYSREELVEVIKNLGKDENPFLADRILKQIAPLFNKLRSEVREAALKEFIQEGGAEDDFQYRPDELSLRFDANYKLIKDKKTKKFKEQDLQRGKNLIIAEEALNELREFVDSEEKSNSFSAFKTIQQKWKDIGDVPSQNSRTLWANYNALIHRFYDQRSIYFELKELDRKKNYESKLKLCDKAEALVGVENLREAIKGLNDLHHEFKHLGPVPQEVQEELWQRFKSASDKVYERRKAFVHELKAELHENLVKKEELIEKITLFIEFQSDRIKEWNEKTKELIALQKAWESIGGLPKEKARHINKEFWSSFKKFFSNKHLFFKKLDADRGDHLIKKQALVEQASALKDSEEWEKTANELKNLQSQWREIGPVPEKMRKKIYEEFKACCDHFFEKRRDGLKSSQENYKVNLDNKKKAIEGIIKLKKDADKNLDKFNELRKEFLEMGYVPKKNITGIKEEFQSAVEDYLKELTVLNIKQKTEISLEAEFAGLAGTEHSETELYHKEQSVRRQINKLEDDIALWQNNLEFFAHSKSTDKLREEVNKKIDDASVHVESLKRQLKMLRSL